MHKCEKVSVQYSSPVNSDSPANSMTGRVCMGEVLTSLAEIHYEMSQLFDQQVNAQKEKKFQGSRKLPQAHKEVCDVNERKEKTRKNDV